MGNQEQEGVVYTDHSGDEQRQNQQHEERDLNATAKTRGSSTKHQIRLASQWKSRMTYEHNPYGITKKELELKTSNKLEKHRHFVLPSSGHLF
ncbi:hypothetical protein PIB30_070974 [Stylosanthes scabra]|uniref:Uncharacterized protein n=1 Tax=Stylosanthes scabra TaxID=79078 RepID=A0ABU6XLG8_9FABA|nr:hypothetical protein [Stylosanthes scabra]